MAATPSKHSYARPLSRTCREIKTRSSSTSTGRLLSLIKEQVLLVSFTYIYTYLCVFVCVCVCVCVYYICIQTYTYLCPYMIYIYISVIDVHMNVYIYTYIYIYIIHIHMHIYIYVHLHICMRRRLCARCAVHKHINHAYKQIWDQTASANSDEYAGNGALIEP
jgi:hypothetical protein